MTQTLQETLQEFPVRQRQILRSYLKRFDKVPSEWLAQKIERLSGGKLVVDWLDSDFGQGPRGGRFNE